MHSRLPKVLHPVCGVPMVQWVIDSARDAGADRVVCITRPGSGVQEALPPGVEAADQTDGEGTGSAILAAREAIEQSDRILILSGDVPLTTAETIEGLVAEHEREGAAATLLTTDKIDPTSYGRIVRGPDDSVERIVETKSTEGVPPEVLAIREINIGTYIFEAPELLAALDEVPVEDNGERYFTSVFPILLARGSKIAAHRTDDTLSALGVNNRADLMDVTSHAQRRIVGARRQRSHLRGARLGGGGARESRSARTPPSPPASPSEARRPSAAAATSARRPRSPTPSSATASRSRTRSSSSARSPTTRRSARSPTSARQPTSARTPRWGRSWR